MAESRMGEKWAAETISTPVNAGASHQAAGDALQDFRSGFSR